ncbi:MAG: hypothetical protein JNL61_19875 [Rhizobiaceae bacterium]|nr:hypothetical protein [Rhizobiaceae bacterium]
MAGNHDALLFLRSWIRTPLRVAAVAPSGRALARLMASEMSPECAPVLELGAGTGVFTRALLARGLAQRDLTLIEQDAAFATLLRARFPQACVLRMDAAGLGDEHRPVPFGAAVSGLPLLSMPQAKVARILASVFSTMRHGASLYQFTYGPRCPVHAATMQELGLTSHRVGLAMANLPPATVYRIALG